MVQTRRYFYCVFLMLCVALGLRAQELTVKRMEVAPMDLSASTQQRNDRNGNPCALVKVQLATAGASFEGNVIGDAEFKKGEYWVYMSEGSYMLNVKHASFLPLFVNFRDFDIKEVESKVTYVLTLVMPQSGPVPVDDGMRYLALSVVPANSYVEIDGLEQQLDGDGTAMIRLSQGSHSYRVKATGYAEETGTVQIGADKVTKEIRLQSVLAQVRVSCPTPGAQIYVNDQLKGTSPWSGTLSAGNYLFEARLSGYRSGRQSETLAERANRQIEIPALVAITGNLDVSYKPMNAEVWLDGKKLGTSPDVFRNIIVGTHEVELRKDGYKSEKKTVTISEGQTASLTGSLTASATSNSYASSASSGASIETFTVNGVSFNMVHVEGGTFQMGSNDSDASSNEQPVHQVTLSTYSIGETEVTQALWEAVMGSNPSSFKGSNLPVEEVSWDDCQTFIRKLNQLTGKRFRLPTEAEWEYAARGGNRSRGYKFSGSNTIDEVAWCWDNRGKKTHAVKTKRANELGLYNMSGNVHEWCQDWYGVYSSNSQTNPKGPSSATFRVYRGGSWGDYARQCRVSFRNGFTPVTRCNYLGLRLAL
ncbi:MAG: SUMF1/EgtB/PvdO family nonheme iron enzyme [Prevotella sp.]|nr:SUMF1/EgtB/PvdO family nonheme iron enzyme [Prevotella sp.]